MRLFSRGSSVYSIRSSTVGNYDKGEAQGERKRRTTRDRLSPDSLTLSLRRLGNASRRKVQYTGSELDE